MSSYSPTHNPIGYEFGLKVITSGLLPNERLITSIEGLYVVRSNRWEWGCIAVSDMRLHFCGSKRFKTITRTFHLSDIQSPVFTQDIGVVQSQAIIFGEGSSFSFDSLGGNHRFLLMRRQADHNKLFVDAFNTAHELALAGAQTSSGYPSDHPHAAYPEVAGRESKRKKILFSFAAAILLFAGFSVANSKIRESRINNAIRNASNEARLVSDDFCSFVESQLAVTVARSQSAYDSVYERYSEADAKIRSIINDKYDIPREKSPYFLLNPLEACNDEAYVRIAPTTTVAPRERSDAETAAEGKTCAQQWRSAARETARGGSENVQLLGTLYACETLEDWITEAFNNGEYSDYLLPVACASEPNAPSTLCD